jgi:subtilisin
MRNLPVRDHSRRGFLHGVGAVVGSSLVGRAAAENSEQLERRVVGTETRRQAERVKRRCARVVRELDFGDLGYAVVGEFPPNAEVELEAASEVRYVEEEADVKLLGRRRPSVTVEAETTPWGVDRIGATAAHDQGTTGAGAHIAILDSGIDSDHPDLRGNLGEGHSLVPCDECRRDWDDDHDHGTHVAGIAGAVANDRGVVGVSTHATVHAVKVISADGHGDSSTIAAGLKWVADQGYDVANLSLGSTSPSSVIADAVTYAYERGVLIVAAAGNERPDEHRLHYPAAFPEAIAVGATDEDDDLTDFSLTGDELEVVAPGHDIPSTVIGDYAVFSGTSMATPHVSGAAGLLVASGYSKAETRERLTSTAVDIGLDSDEQGHGRIDVQAALGGQGGGGGFSVSTRSATGVEPPNATLNGELLGLGDYSAADVAFEYWVKGDRQATATTVAAGSQSAAGMFSADVADLVADETYVFVATATADGETVRGTRHEFTTGSDSGGGTSLTVETGQPTPVDEDEVSLVGRVTEMDGIEEVETYFEFWEQGDKDDTLDDESGDDLEEPGQFQEDVDDFEPGTTYVVVAHAYDEDDESVAASGEPKTFSLGNGSGGDDPSLAVETGQPTPVEEDEVTLVGRVTEMDGIEEVETYFEFWEQGDESTRDDESGDDLEAPGQFQEDVDDFESGTTYVVVAHAYDEDDESVAASGEPKTFSLGGEGDEPTDASLSVTTRQPVDIDHEAAELRGALTELTGIEEVETGFEYWQKGSSGSATRLVADDSDEPEPFDEDADDLKCDTAYVAVAVATSADGHEARGSPVEFTTEPN